MKPKIAIIRGKFLNAYEMQFFEPLTDKFDLVGFGSLYPMAENFDFPVVKLPSPMDLPDFPGKMPVLNRIFTDAHYLWGLERKLAGFDLVHSAETYYRYTQQALNAKKRGLVKKVIATVLENIPFNNEGIHGRKEFKARSRSELDHMIALTELTRQTLITEGTDPDNISTLGHFIDTKKFSPRTEKSHNTNKTIVLFCGRLEEYKGIFDIVEAAKLIYSDPKIANKAFFKFVGQGSQKKRLLDLIAKYGLTDQFEFTDAGYEKMPDIYREADIYVAPSKPSKYWIEQYNTTLLEAQASGLAIITTNSGGIPENVGNTARLIDPGDIPALTRELTGLISLPRLREDMGRLARKRAEKVHDIRIGARKLAQIYGEVLNG